MPTDSADNRPMGRRAFVKNGTLLLAAASVENSLCAEDVASSPVLRIGLITDLHYADKPPAGSRHYRETPDKLAVAAAEFAAQKPEFIVELGDFVDAADSVEIELEYLQRINKPFTAISDHRHYVLGNHCVYTLTKQEFLDGVGCQRSYYSFDTEHFHFIVLDSCFRSDGEPYGRKNFEWTDPNIPAKEVAWLRADLKATSKKTIVFAHQRLDVSDHYGVKNAAEVRAVLQTGNVLAVFQGHSHENDYHEIAGIHYCTLVAMVEGSGAENNAFAVMQVTRNGTIQIEGFCKQDDYQWQA